MRRFTGLCRGRWQQATVTALQRGVVKVAQPLRKSILSKVFTINISRNDFKTNVPDLKLSPVGEYVDSESLYNQNTSSNELL